MKQYIGCDAPARYSILVTLEENGKAGPPVRVEHDELEMRRYWPVDNAGVIQVFGARNQRMAQDIMRLPKDQQIL